ncbi:protein SHORT HYPOCOTYL IN WHITE LIGHT 1 isoform X2 [Rhodamnia argentea]|uniref:Protein SHORT HYPOCOTYL IN WHITE LIGHT 1 isoform X2 n=1 Tax=Rhodamnia argentea TaxID=178133 RepID=A0A8B8QT44_9MYRT|nr:protein SHORT HYPOCOTYL IN WHITE LIGHT 1 isoform X2 [Rhodamnia argentea]
MLKLRLLRLAAVAPPIFPRQPIAANSFSIAPHQPPPHFSLRLRASRRVSDFPQVGGARNWSRAIESVYGGGREEYDGGDGGDEEEDRSLDLLVRFVQNVFRKVSRRARKAVRSVLPVSISTQLVSFSVNGVLILAFLWVLKAFLEVVCTLGSIVFVSILLIRGVWSGVTYMQENRSYRRNEADDDHRAWTRAQPVT